MGALVDMTKDIARVSAQRFARVHELETALNRMVCAYENTLAESDGRFPLKDAGCPDCTSGTVQNNRNTGRCAYHHAKVLLGFL